MNLRLFDLVVGAPEAALPGGSLNNLFEMLHGRLICFILFWYDAGWPRPVPQRDLSQHTRLLHARQRQNQQNQVLQRLQRSVISFLRSFEGRRFVVQTNELIGPHSQLIGPPLQFYEA